ncbi:MAG: [FeFe] hydrogenase H-cluster radical SAM maturase HydE [Bacteroidales bacterium]|nr:[FeFe] hydrogenase H-cluster radical SAM maturase HydE [Bacteroidales bacterium]
MSSVALILKEERLDKESLVELLNSKQTDLILNKAAQIKAKYIGNKVHLRGLIELSNRCNKNCYYCGIRAANKNVKRFMLSDEEVDRAIRFAVANNLGSIVIQSGELQSEEFTEGISHVLQRIEHIGEGTLGVTLSCGEQTKEVYQQWKDAGAIRYLLRIEASGKNLYQKLHPNNSKHSYEKRLQALHDLKQCGYQTGTGVMIGAPFQTLENLADDLLFMRDLDIDMCGMGPYIEHVDTLFYQYHESLPSKKQRLDWTLKMIAILRIMMKDINIASTTAMQSLVNGGREMALHAGANVLMPNITPGIYRELYSLYENKPGINEEASDSKLSIENIVQRAGGKVAYNEQGNSRHFTKRN